MVMMAMMTSRADDEELTAGSPEPEPGNNFSSITISLEFQAIMADLVNSIAEQNFRKHNGLL